MTLIRAHTRTRTLRAREAYTENGGTSGTSDTSRVQALDLDRRCRLCDLRPATEEASTAPAATPGRRATAQETNR
jgi:hypothetical protein